MSDDHSKYQPAPGATSAEGAYLRNPQEPSYYYHDANQYAVYSPASVQAPAQALANVPASAPSAPSALGSWFNVTSPDYLKGFLLGAGVTLVATNPKVRKTIVSGAVKLWAAVQGGVEELKEQVLDAKAELSKGE
jgi:hypothetical protein